LQEIIYIYDEGGKYHTKIYDKNTGIFIKKILCPEKYQDEELRYIVNDWSAMIWGHLEREDYKLSIYISDNAYIYIYMIEIC
jgi:hypothetical protein